MLVSVDIVKEFILFRTTKNPHISGGDLFYKENTI